MAAFICIFLTVSDLERVFMCLLAFCFILLFFLAFDSIETLNGKGDGERERDTRRLASL